MVFGFCCLGSVQGLQHLENEEIVPVHETAIYHSALVIGEALTNQGRLHALGRQPGQAELLELRNVTASAIADIYDFLYKAHRRNCDDALFCRPQCRKALVDAGNKRRLKFDHNMPGHRNDIGTAVAGGVQQNDRARFKQLIDFR